MIRSVSSTPRPLPVRPQARPVATPVRAAVQPQGGGMSLGSTGNMIQTGGKLATWWNGASTGLRGGNVVNGAMGQIFQSLKRLNGNGLLNGLKGMASGALPYATRAGMFQGAVSVVTNGVKLAQGQIRFSEFGSRVVGDTMAGIGGGAAAAVAGALALAFLPVTGTMATIVAGVAGIAGFALGDGMVRNTSLYRKVTGTIRNGLR